MPMYYFNLKDVQNIYADPDGVDLRDEAHVLEYAHQVAQELMQSRQVKTRSWRLQVCDVDHKVLFELLFATVDHTMHQLPPELRRTVETVSARTAGLSDAIHDMRTTLHQIKGTLARCDGAPYLAAFNGCRLDL